MTANEDQEVGMNAGLVRPVTVHLDVFPGKLTCADLLSFPPAMGVKTHRLLKLLKQAAFSISKLIPSVYYRWSWRLFDLSMMGMSASRK